MSSRHRILFGFLRLPLEVRRRMSSASKWPPIVVVLGATASGKSKLAIDIACNYNGEVISADSMQVYKGLDLLTNKVTDEESRGVPHHMISVIDPTVKFDVQNYRQMALPILEDLLSKKKMPVVVGGTNYYIESLLWKVLVNKVDVTESFPLDSEPGSKRLKLDRLAEDENCVTDELMSKVFEAIDRMAGDAWKEDIVEAFTNDELHQVLTQVDPKRAARLHVNDRRKVVRSIQIFRQTGKVHSFWIEKQALEAHAVDTRNSACTSASSGDDEPEKTLPQVSHLGGSMRFDNVIFLWIDAPLDLLRKRIDDRVDSMVENGLKEELHNYYETWVVDKNEPESYTHGQLQSIGYKEFKDYLALTPEERVSAEGVIRFQQGCEALKLVTRQYAKRQLKWIKQRFLRPSRRAVPPVYGLNGSSTVKQDWENNVTSIAFGIIEAHKDPTTDQSLLVKTKVPIEDEPYQDDMQRRVCEVCDRVLMGMVQWDLHMKSYKHRKMLKRKQKAEKREQCQVEVT